MKWGRLGLRFGSGLLVATGVVSTLGVVSRVQTMERQHETYEILWAHRQLLDRGVSLVRAEERLLRDHLLKVDVAAWRRINVLRSSRK